MSGSNPFKAIDLSSGNTRTVLITVALVVVAVVWGYFGVVPLHGKIGRLQEEIRVTNESIGTAQSAISGMTELEQRIAESLTALKEEHKAGVLVPYRNSYEMAARQVVTPLAQQAGLKVVSARELPAVALQHVVANPPANRGYQRQPVEFTLEGSYWQICEFIGAVGQRQSLAGLYALSINSQGGSPEVHKAVVTFEWPAPVDAVAMAATLESSEVEL